MSRSWTTRYPSEFWRFVTTRELQNETFVALAFAPSYIRKTVSSIGDSQAKPQNPLGKVGMDTVSRRFDFSAFCRSWSNPQSDADQKWPLFRPVSLPRSAHHRGGEAGSRCLASRPERLPDTWSPGVPVSLHETSGGFVGNAADGDHSQLHGNHKKAWKGKSKDSGAMNLRDGRILRHKFSDSATSTHSRGPGSDVATGKFWIQQNQSTKQSARVCKAGRADETEDLMKMDGSSWDSAQFGLRMRSSRWDTARSRQQKYGKRKSQERVQKPNQRVALPNSSDSSTNCFIRPSEMSGPFRSSGHTIRGVVEEIKFSGSSKSVFTLVNSQRNKFTAVVYCALDNVHCGQPMLLTGSWDYDTRFGQQFKVRSYTEAEVDPIVDARNMLQNINGVGPQTANDILAKFGTETLDVVRSDDAVRELQKVKGIGRKRAAAIVAAHHEMYRYQGAMKSLMDWGVSHWLQKKLIGHFGEGAIVKVQEDPYQHIMSLAPSCSFSVMDKIASRCGASLELESRLWASLLGALKYAAANGHSFLPWAELKQEGARLLQQPVSNWQGSRDLLEAARSLMKSDRLVVYERVQVIKDETQDDEGVDDGTKEWAPDYRCQLMDLDSDEEAICRGVVKCLKGPGNSPTNNMTAEAMLKRCVSKAGIRMQHDLESLSDGQMAALFCALESNVMVLTGGPGCGKTHVVKVMVNLFHSQDERVSVCAPTGRAASKLQQAIGIDGIEASTIHRLLGCTGRPDGQDSEELQWRASSNFIHDSQVPLEADVVIVDEASMMDLTLAAGLISALPDGCKLILVGDPDQLDPVGPGSVLKDIIDSGIVPVVDLRQIHRQCKGSAIVRGAHAINQGQLPDFHRLGPDDLECFSKGLSVCNDLKSDAFWVEANNGANADSEIQDLVIKVVKRLGSSADVRLDGDLQVLSCTKRQERKSSTHQLNSLLQDLINPAAKRKDEIISNKSSGEVWRVGDRVIQCQNDYDMEVYNGDIGYLASVDKRDGSVQVRYPPKPGTARARLVEYTASKLRDLKLAWSTTVHKAQGAEFPVVVMPLAPGHRRSLVSRSLLYTAVTRAKCLLILISTQGAIRQCLDSSTLSRHSMLAYRLKNAGKQAQLPRMIPKVFM